MIRYSIDYLSDPDADNWAIYECTESLRPGMVIQLACDFHHAVVRVCEDLEGHWITVAKSSQTREEALEHLRDHRRGR